MTRKAILAFSGGLDTSVAVKYLQEGGMDVVTVTVDVGQGGDYKTVAAKSKKLGAKNTITLTPQKSSPGITSFRR